MASRKALLVGAERYGDGFAALPAVRRDLELLNAALQAGGYETEICSDTVAANATELDALIREFCRSGDSDDIRIVYFSGHGLRVDDTDWIIPAGASRNAAALSATQRVSTDLSATVAASTVGLVLFIIDACRDRDDVPVTKGSGAWGNAGALKRPAEARFIRFFGCDANEVCQVLAPAPGEEPSSLFTRALAESLASKDAASLEDLQAQVQRRCDAVLAAHPQLQPQTPHLSFGEITAEKSAVLKRAVFDPLGDGSLAPVWAAFDPGKLHCLVVLSEYANQHPDEWGLTNLVKLSLAGGMGNRVWKAFRGTCDQQKLVSGQKRSLPESIGPDTVAFAAISVLDAYGSPDAFDRTVRAIVEADLVVFDVTKFEPGVMLLAGIRSASRRGLSVSSHGAGWQEGLPIDIPFNLQDLNLNSHTRANSSIEANKNIIGRFVQRVEWGFRQLGQQPSYLDLPGYDALRRLGAEYSASSTISVAEQVLVLCSYDDGYSANWEHINEQLTITLSDRAVTDTKIQRIIDYGTSQLVLEGLYEQIRRTAACVVDWSEFRASVFLELGARLAASEWGAVHIVDQRYTPGRKPGTGLAQIARMQKLLKPVVYDRKDGSKPFEAVAEALARSSPNVLDPAAPGYNRVYRVLLDTIHLVHKAAPPLAVELSRQADALHHPLQSTVGAPQILYSGSRPMKEDAERTAAELRVAAWLYLEHRLTPAARKADAEVDELYRTLGRAAKDALFDMNDDDSVALALTIDERLTEKD